MARFRAANGATAGQWRVVRTAKWGKGPGRVSSEARNYAGVLYYALDPGEDYFWIVDIDNGRILRVGLRGHLDAEMQFSKSPDMDFCRTDLGWHVEAIATNQSGQLLLCTLSAQDYPGTPRQGGQELRHRLFVYDETLSLLSTRDFVLPDKLAPLVTNIAAMTDGSLVVTSEDVIGNGEVQALTCLDRTGALVWSGRRTGDEAPDYGNIFSVGGRTYMQQPGYAMDRVVVVKRVSENNGSLEVLHKLHGRLLLGLDAARNIFILDFEREDPDAQVPTEVLKYSSAGTLLSQVSLPVETPPERMALLIISARGRVFLADASGTGGLNIWMLE